MAKKHTRVLNQEVKPFNWNLVKIPFTSMEDRARVLLAFPALTDFGLCPPTAGRTNPISLDEINKCRLFIRCARMNPEGDIDTQNFPWKTKYGKDWGVNGKSSYMWVQLISKWIPPIPGLVLTEKVCNGAMIVAAVLEGLKITPVYDGTDAKKVNPSCWISKPKSSDRPNPPLIEALSMVGQITAAGKGA